jgi:Transcriptional regulator, contains sigma factor-related N-terminal domain
VTGLEQHRARPAVSLEAAIVARRYYIDGKQKSEIADELRISRFKVARLLDEARASGIVRIYVDMPAEIDMHMGEALASAFGVQRAIVVRSSADTADVDGLLIGSAAAEYLQSRISATDILGISWGTSLTSVVNAITRLEPADLVQLVGGMRAGQMDVGGIELVRRLSEKTSGRAYPLHAPLLVRTAEMAQQLRQDPSLADVIGRFDRLTVALVGIGSWSPPRSSLFKELAPAERTVLEGLGAVADMCTIVFDGDGQPIESASLARSVGITFGELRRVPEVIAVAGGAEKVHAIAAALRSGVVNTIVTDSLTAASLIAK